MDKTLRYPIRAVAKLTGMQIDTLRAWERRYGIVEPERDSRGRLYSEEDVRKLRMLHDLVEAGHPIGRLAGLPEARLSALLHGASTKAIALDANATPTQSTPRANLDFLLTALARFDSAAIDRELGRLAALLSPRDLVLGVVLPLMRQVGDAWFEKRLTAAQEHLASASMRNVLGALVRAHVPERPPLRLMFATPEGELHEFGILAAAMLAATGGLGLVYLGTNLPASEILDAAKRSDVRAVVLAVSGASGGGSGVSAVHRLVQQLPRGIEIWVGGALSETLAAKLRRTGATYLEDFNALESELRRLGARF